MFIKDFTASTRQNDLIFGIKLPHHELYRVSAFQICQPSTSCLPISESGGIHVPWTHFVFILHRQSVFINWLILSLFYIDNRSSSIDFCIDWDDFNKTLSIGLLFIFVTVHVCMHNTHAATLDVKKPRYFLHILYREGIESV